MNIIFDLDGTLIDSRLRMYRLFKGIVPTSKLTFEEYWAFKRDKVSHETLLIKEFGFGPQAINGFVSDWMSRIELPEFLAFDTNFPGMHETLDRLGKQARLYVCTARQYRQTVIEQLDSLGLLPYFESVMVTEQRNNKETMIAKLSGLNSQDWLIGDTGKDIEVGKLLGIKTCAVLTGFLSENKLKPYHPDLILPAVTKFFL